MENTRKLRQKERLIGAAFIVATLTYSTGNGMLTSYLNVADPNAGLLVLGMILEGINSLMVILAGLLTFAVLKDQHPGLLAGYKWVRTTEGLLLGLGTAAVLLPLFMPAVDGSSAISIRAALFNVAMILLGSYSVIFCWFLYQQRLIHKLLSVMGMIGYGCLVVYAGLGLLGLPASLGLFLPGAVFELAYPVVLIGWGFRRV